MAITSLTLPAACSKIGDYGLCNTNLTQLNNAYGIISLGDYALANNTSLTSLFLQSITSLADSDYTFNNSGLTNIEFGNLTSVSTNTFAGLTSLTTFINSASLSTIDLTWFPTGVNI